MTNVLTLLGALKQHCQMRDVYMRLCFSKWLNGVKFGPSKPFHCTDYACFTLDRFYHPSPCHATIEDVRMHWLSMPHAPKSVESIPSFCTWVYWAGAALHVLAESDLVSCPFVVQVEFQQYSLVEMSQFLQPLATIEIQISCPPVPPSELGMRITYSGNRPIYIKLRYMLIIIWTTAVKSP